MKSVLGRLFQVEYAMEAISHAPTCLGLLTKDGVLLAAQKQATSALIEQIAASEKLYVVDG